jgi:long-chain acyl-CoA synthetase
VSNIASHLFRRASESALQTAVIFGTRRLTFSDIHSQVCRIAAGLTAAGFMAGDKLGIMVAAAPEFIFFEYAAFTLGGVVVPLNSHYVSNEIEYALGSCDVDFLVVQDVFLDRISSGMVERLTSLQRIFVLGRWPLADVPPRTSGAAPLWNHVAAVTSVTERENGDLALMLHTSATTGKAKGVMLTVGNLQANYDCTPAWLGLASDDCILCALPLYNTFGLNQCINAIMVTGAAMVLLPRYNVMDCLEAIQAHRCTFLPAVPTMLQKILNDPAVAGFDLTSIRRLLVGGAPVPAPLLDQVYKTMGRTTVVMTGYGLTEATALVSLEHTSPDEWGNVRRPKTIGRVLPGMQMMIADEDGSELPPHQVGQILIKGPNVMKGYYKMKAETARAVVNGWLLSGDLGIMDEERYFYIVDRKKDLIIRGGQNIYPADIEEVLYLHPAVAEAAVIGRSDDVLGEVPEAFVALKPGGHVTAHELLELCKAELAYFKVPKSVHFLDELPKGPTGKILRRGLRGAAAPAA